ncbi:hypothetical protein GGX14DRAFT_407212 [Mycena pura]|uniref:Uncharacterized protein n=1 Tax=Mycena pura TaxID=153505 RepID=A0AAD6USK6_9AGAR|nr:hypothetical protein GGX14DRAFT_407212 [Mycena pura]
MAVRPLNDVQTYSLASEMATMASVGFGKRRKGDRDIGITREPRGLERNGMDGFRVEATWPCDALENLGECSAPRHRYKYGQLRVGSEHSGQQERRGARYFGSLITPQARSARSHHQRSVKAPRGWGSPIEFAARKRGAPNGAFLHVPARRSEPPPSPIPTRRMEPPPPRWDGTGSWCRFRIRWVITAFSRSAGPRERSTGRAITRRARATRSSTHELPAAESGARCPGPSCHAVQASSHWGTNEGSEPGRVQRHGPQFTDHDLIKEVPGAQMHQGNEQSPLTLPWYEIVIPILLGVHYA